MENLSESDDRIGLVDSETIKKKAKWRRYLTLFAVKPVTIFYSMSFLISGSVTSQLWIDRTCRVDLGYNATVCDNLREPEYKDINEIVQKQVTTYNIFGIYFEIISIMSTLYLGISHIYGTLNYTQYTSSCIVTWLD
jgi:hypothetical protein